MHFHRLILSKALIQTQRKYIWKYYLNTESYIIKMTQFDDREKAEERKFATKEEAEFKANARRNKLVGLWAAQLLGLEGDKANAVSYTHLDVYKRQILIYINNYSFMSIGNANLKVKYLKAINLYDF